MMKLEGPGPSERAKGEASENNGGLWVEVLNK
jgi:hypothetical protein